jgi:hypothetical protein
MLEHPLLQFAQADDTRKGSDGAGGMKPLSLAPMQENEQ